VIEKSRKKNYCYLWAGSSRKASILAVYLMAIYFLEKYADLGSYVLFPIEWRMRWRALLSTFLDTITECVTIQERYVIETCLSYKLQVISFCSSLVFYVDTSEKSISVFRSLNDHAL